MPEATGLFMSDSPNKEKDTVKFSTDSKDRARSLLRTLLRCNYFRDGIPSEAELSRTLRIPRTSISTALHVLAAENLVGKQSGNQGWVYHGWPNQTPTGQVTFVVNTDILRGWYSLFQDWLIGFEHVMSSEGYETQILCDFLSPQDKIQKIRQSWERGSMGVMLASHTEAVIRQFLVDSGIPAAMVGNANTTQEELGSICSDNRGGIEKLVGYLLSQNHSDIGFYSTGLGYHDGFRERLSSYVSVMRHNGLEPRHDLAFTEPHSENSARKAAEIIYRQPSKPSAILCASDREAFELVTELKHLGLEVPRNISITGFDNNHYGQILEPSMTTIDIFAIEMGRVAANYLLNEMQVRQLPVKILLPTRLMARNSVQACGNPTIDPHAYLTSSGQETNRILTF